MKTKAPLTISIIVPAYNEEGYIQGCLDSILQYAGKAHEIIVIDNASTDNTYEIVSKMPGVKIVKEPKKGLTSARQKGYQQATGDIIAFLDADTHMQPYWFERVTYAFEFDPKLVFLSGPYSFYDMARYKQIGNWLYWRLFAYPSYLVTGYLGVGGNMVMRKSMLEAVGGFDTTIQFYGEDTNIARRASEIGKCGFMLDLSLPTSARRLKAQGTIKTVYLYWVNYLYEVLFHKACTHSYKDYR